MFFFKNFHFFLNFLCLQICFINCVQNFFSQPKQQNKNDRCEDARLKCAFRMDCGQALHSYMIHCADLISGQVNGECPVKCSKALISLASTELGSKLIDCNCGNSQFCKLSKERVQICKEYVEHQLADDTIVTCSTAKLICASDTQCLTALTYYNRFCKAMFKGKLCTKRCLNSLSILQRQRNAYKLNSCVCDGTEDFPCESIKHNTEKLCLKKKNYLGPAIELLDFEEQKISEKKDDKLENRNKILIQRKNRPLYDTLPMDFEQIKKNIYFNIMMSEALSSANQAFLSSSVFILILIHRLLVNII